MTLTKLVFVDTETTSLNRHTRRAWEIALLARRDGVDHTMSWFIDAEDLDLAHADPMSLKIGRFHERHPQYADDASTTSLPEAAVAEVVESMTRGAILVGAVPSFDEETLDAMLRRHNHCPAWHYHLVDVETLAAGALRMEPPWDFDAVLAAYGLTYDEAARHTAVGDARMVRDLYDAVMSGQSTKE